MGAAENKKLVRETWDAFWRGDIEAGLANMWDDITWTVADAGPLGGPKSGKEEMGRFRRLLLNSVELKREVIGLHGDGNTVVMEVVGRGRLKNGQPYENAAVTIWEVEEGKIRRVREYVFDIRKALAVGAD
jgi:uncharacterized protein